MTLYGMVAMTFRKIPVLALVARSNVIYGSSLLASIRLYYGRGSMVARYGFVDVDLRSKQEYVHIYMYYLEYT